MAKAKKPVSSSSDTEKKTSTSTESPTTSKTPDSAKASPSKPTAAKSSTAKATEPKPAETRTTPAKGSTVKPDPKPADTASAKSAPAEPKPEVKATASSVPSVSKPDPAKPDAKPQEPVKRDNVVSSFEKPGAASDRPTIGPEKPEAPKAVENDTPKPVESKPASPQNTAPPSRNDGGSTFWPLVVGGVIAAVLGFLASEINMFGTRADTSELRTALSRQQAEIAALKDAPSPAADVEFPELETLSGQVSQLSETLTADISELQDRMAAIEKRPVPAGGLSEADAAAYENELKSLQDSVSQQQSEIEGLLKNARSVEEATAEAARQAALQTALTRVTAAINNGKPFAGTLDELGANGVDEIPQALSDVAQDGPATLISLQTSFPENARAALGAARVADPSSDDAGMGGFLRRQLGARSVAPREGSDPDAVLSRAEAAVREGRLTDALAELDTLPDAAKTAMNDWLTDARARQAAEAATDDLSQRLTAN